MGMYNLYEGIQLKVDRELTLKEFKVGDKVKIKDGVYLAYGGVIVIINKIFVAKYKHVFDKWGDELKPHHLIDRYNPLTKVMRKVKRQLNIK